MDGHQLAEKIKNQLESITDSISATLPPNFGLMVFFYNLGVSPVDAWLVSTHGDPGEILRILRATARRLLDQYSGALRRFGMPSRPAGKPVRIPQVITQALMTIVGGKEQLILYGDKSEVIGELILNPGESVHVVGLLGLVDKS
jgi:hypothetical protein